LSWSTSIVVARIDCTSCRMNLLVRVIRTYSGGAPSAIRGLRDPSRLGNPRLCGAQETMFDRLRDVTGRKWFWGVTNYAAGLECTKDEFGCLRLFLLGRCTDCWV